MKRFLIHVSTYWCGMDDTFRAVAESEMELWEHLIAEKFEIFLVTPDCYTIRARFPEGYKYQGVADFVMARKEVGYIPGTRTPIVEPGNLYDDLLRRDFTVNALAKDPDTGEIIDYFGGLKDIKEKLLRTPLPPIITFDDDPLRILRGIRFSITKRLRVSEDMWQAMKAYDYLDKMPVVWVRTYYVLGETTILVKSECLFSVEEL